MGFFSMTGLAMTAMLTGFVGVVVGHRAVVLAGVGGLAAAAAIGLRSSRRIARALEEDVGFRVVAANQQPDFRTICRFRAEHEEALEKLFVEVLRLCHEAGLVKLGVVTLDGTKVAANAALATNRSHQAIEEEVQRMLAEAKAADAEEDAHYGPDRRGDELPEGLGDGRSGSGA